MHRCMVPLSAGQNKGAALQKMYAFPIKLNLWKDVENTIFPHGIINFPKIWKDDVYSAFQSLEWPDFKTFPNWK